MNPQADADKTFTANNNTCYLATAANMLAEAGYGTGANLQARSDDIYNDLIAQFGTAPTGWTDVALDWWLNSANNTWTSNPYNLVTVYGNKSPRNPWANPDGARDIGNELRTCHPVGISISWPVAGTQVGSGGHAITAWGDGSWMPWKKYSETISSNPGAVKVTDSDRDTGGDLQSYDYDDYTNPNPGGPNEGNGWYFDYDNNHPYIKHIIVLEPTVAGGGGGLQKVVGSYKIHQSDPRPATDLHYKVGTDTEILSYVTILAGVDMAEPDWVEEHSPDIVEGPGRRHIEVDWDLSDNPVENCHWVTITTEFVLRMWNEIVYEDVRFTYPDMPDIAVPDMGWIIRTPPVANAVEIPNVTGGYVVASFDIADPTLPDTERRVGEYRLIHQYSFTQDPEQHTLLLRGQPDLEVRNLRVGHSYGLPDTEALWTFRDWMTEYEGEVYRLSDTPVQITIDWEGQLPYPRGEDIRGRVPDIEREGPGRRTEPD